ncbi:hypothetical protein, partial [Burkholderia oklahomensis]|uniref:hypothetical protein n=1 Tax=Burkholderia oklahomensis TaxID=342113 RepID=UPI001E61016B
MERHERRPQSTFEASIGWGRRKSSRTGAAPCAAGPKRASDDEVKHPLIEVGFRKTGTRHATRRTRAIADRRSPPRWRATTPYAIRRGKRDAARPAAGRGFVARRTPPRRGSATAAIAEHALN